MRIGFGIDVGGSGIKGAPVDLDQGRMLTERIRITTPQPATPDAVMDGIAQVVARAEWKGPLGCAFPSVVLHGVTYNATNMHPSWTGINAQQMLRDRLNRAVYMLNDADAAGQAEMRFGAGSDWQGHGVVIMLTFGTGIGSAIFVDGKLVPNTELGELELEGHKAEKKAAGQLRENHVLSWDTWIERVQQFLAHVELLFWPDLIIFGGGISEQSDVFLPQLQTRARLVPARLFNNAGIVGAACAAAANASA